MGDVDHWLLLIEPGESQAIKTVNKALRKEGGKKMRFRILDEDSWGGIHHPLAEVYGMAIDPVPQQIVFDAVRSAEWNEPDNCVLVFYPEDGGWQFFPVDNIRGQVAP